jgi:hypothetical protein
MTPWALANAQVTSYVLPQLAFGGGWYSALYFTNQNASAASFAVNLVDNQGAPLLVPSLGGTSTSAGYTVAVNLPANGSVVIETPNVGPLNQGYATFVLPSGVVGYGVFRQSANGRSAQEAVVPFSSTASTASTLIWDETSFVTDVAMVNPSSVDTIVTVTALDQQGNTLGTSTVALPAYNKVVSELRSLKGLGGIVGKQGTAQFTVAKGSVSVLGLRFDGSAFTSIPVTANAPQAAAPPFTSLNVYSQFQPLYAPLELVAFTITPTNGGTEYTATFPEGTTLVGGTATTNSQGMTLTFNNVQALPNSWFAPLNVVLQWVSKASLSLSVTQVSSDPVTGMAVGNVSGLLTVTGTGVAGSQLMLSGPVFGTYVEPGPRQ